MSAFIARNDGMCDEWMMEELHKYVMEATPKKMRMMLVTDGGKPVIECFNPQCFSVSKGKDLGTLGNKMYFTSYNTPDSRFDFMKPKPKMQTPVVYCPFGAKYNPKYNKFYINMMLDGMNEATANFMHHLNFWRFSAEVFGKKLYHSNQGFYTSADILQEGDNGLPTFTVKANPEVPVFDCANVKMGPLMDIKIPRGARLRAIVEMVGYFVRCEKIEVVWKITQVNLIDKKQIECNQSMFVDGIDANEDKI